MNKIWEFLPKPTKMPLMTSTFHNVLTSSGFSEEERLVREALQNSTDAHAQSAKAPVSVTFENRSLEGDPKLALVHALSLYPDIYERRELLGLPSGNALETITDSAVPLRALSISDYHTTGLTGVWNGTGKDDHFGRLVVNLGLDDKPDPHRPTGGSFGFGKTVYAKSSGVGIVIFYSVFSPSDATEGAHARFMSTGLFKPHHYRGTEFTGFAFQGVSARESHEALPFTDDAAHQMAAACGLTVRAPDQPGTTILIIDCDLDVVGMRQAAEKYWWPRLTRSDLDVKFIDDGSESYPRPRGNPVLQPFLRALRNLDSNHEEKPQSKLYRAQRVRQSSGEMKRRGDLSCVLLETESELRNRVALVRQPGMVVSYLGCGSDSFEDCIGVFRAHPDVETMLTYSEPQIHNIWDPNSDRLKGLFGQDGPATVASIRRFLESRFRDFQRLQEPPIPRDGVDARQLSKLLGRFLKIPGVTPPKPVSDVRPIAINVREHRVHGDGVVYDVADFAVSVRAEIASNDIDCVVIVTHEILGDASERVIERSPVTLLEGQTILTQGNPARQRITVHPDQPTRIRARAVSDPLYVTRLRISVEES